MQRLILFVFSPSQPTYLFYKTIACLLCLLMLPLSGCFIAKGEDAKRAACNTLKSKIVFNAATADTRRAGIERATLPFTEYAYDKQCQP